MNRATLITVLSIMIVSCEMSKSKTGPFTIQDVKRHGEIRKLEGQQEMLEDLVNHLETDRGCNSILYWARRKNDSLLQEIIPYAKISTNE